MDLQLADRTIIVTGGSSGVGLATVGLLLDEGARVVTCARDGERLRDATTELDGRHPGRLLAIAGDVREERHVQAMAAATVERFGGVDGLVNNAGSSRMTTFATTSDDEWRDELELKVFSVVRPVRAVMASLRRSPVAAIVNVNAILARQPESRLVATSAARAAVLNLSRSLATELAPVRVNAVLLGLVDTGQWRRRWEESRSDQPYDEWAADLAADRGALLRRLGSPDEVAAMIVTLLSPRASFVTGATLDVGGGIGRYV